MTDFNGTASANVTLSADSFVSGTTGFSGTSGSAVISFTNGVGTLTLPAVSGGASGSATIDVSNLSSTNGQSVASNFPTASAAVTLAQPSATGLKVTSQLPDLSVNTAGSSDSVTVQVTDQSGNPVAASEIVTLTLTGPGSFSSTSAQTSTTVLTSAANGAVQVPVYGEQGVQGTITVSGVANGAVGSVSVPTYVTGTPSQLAISSSTSTSGGVSYTAYTVDVEDANGHVVSNISQSSGLVVTLTPNGGTLNAYENVTQPTGTVVSGATSFDVNVNNGQATFVLENTATGSANAGVLVSGTISGASLSASSTYPYEVGGAAKVAVVNAVPSATLAPGSTETVTVQLEDSNGNALAQAGQAVDFFFNAANTSAGVVTFPNGTAPTASANTQSSSAYVVDTNSQGKASVTVSISSSATSGSFQVLAELAGTSATASGPWVSVQPASSGAIGASLAVSSGLFGTVSAGTFLSGSVTLDNALGAVATGNSTDTIEITTSNDNVIAVPTASTSGWSPVSGTTTSVEMQVSSGSAAVASGVLEAKQAGTATLTFTDLSNPSVPAVSETVTVTVGSYGTGYLEAVAPTGANNGVLTVSSSGVYGPFTIEVTDAGGNVLPAPEAITIPSSALYGSASAIVNYSSGLSVAGVRTSPTASDQTFVTIPAGATSVQVYYDVSLVTGTTSGTLTAEPSTSVLLDSVVPIASGLTVSATSANAVVSNFGSPTVSWVSGATVTLYDVQTQSTVTGTISSAGSATTVTFTFASGALTSGQTYDLQGVTGVTRDGNNEVVTSAISNTAN